MSIAKELVDKHAKVPAVVLIATAGVAKKMITATQRLSPNKTFVWIGTDGWSRFALNFNAHHQLMDSLLLDLHDSHFSVFRNWYANLTPDRNSSPWFRQQWEDHFNCSFDDGTCNRSGNIPESYPISHLEYVADAVLMTANAISRVLRSENCRNLTRSTARNCVTGPRLLRELKATQLDGYSGRIELNPEGDRYGNYDIQQLRLASSGQYWLETVCGYNNRKNQLKKVANVTWTNFKTQPESYCSKPCAPHHAIIAGDIHCCWKCKRCEANQYLIDEGRVCKRCHKLTWPNPNTDYSSCYRLKPRTIRNTNVEGAMVIILPLIGLSVSVTLVLYYLRCRDNPIIANGRALSFFMLLAITSGYLTIILFYITPSQNLCRIIFLLFSTSIASIYGALLVRAIDVFRWYIIRKPSSRKHSKPRTHFMFAGIISFLQAVICTTLMSSNQRWHGLTQSFPGRPYVDHTCTMTHAGFICFCVYNCLLLVICIFLTFHTPENAETEDRLIFTCVCLIIIIWLCIVPGYVLAIEQFHRIMFWVLFLFLNCSVVILVIFLPKVKAVWYEHNKVVVFMPNVAAFGKVSLNDQTKINTFVRRETTTSMSSEP